MKTQFLAIIALCLFAYTTARKIDRDWPPKPTGPCIPERLNPLGSRLRRHADPQGSITMQGTKPLSGPDRRPSIDLNYNQRIINRDRTKADVYGGMNLREEQLTPHAGINVERNFKNNGFVRGFGQVQPDPNSRMSPTLGVGTGFRFKSESEFRDEDTWQE